MLRAAGGGEIGASGGSSRAAGRRAGDGSESGGIRRAGYVLVGGRSSRMGRDKALLPYRGDALARRVAAEVRAAAGSVALVGSPSRHGGLGCGVVPDVFPGDGPLGGILTALQNTTATWNLLVACDMPRVSAVFLDQLCEAAESWDVDALLPAGPGRRLEPLCAVYHRRSRQALYAAFLRGVRKITDALEGLRVAAYLVPEDSSLVNINTPEDWAPYAAE